MSTRRAASLIETLVAIAIVGILLTLLLPAVITARRRALEVGCKNNLHQINLAIADFAETYRRLPGPGSNGQVGGWTIDVLPFLDQKNLWDRITPGKPILTAPDFLLRRPRILSCPLRNASNDPTSSMMDDSDYVFVPSDRRQSFLVFDAPLEVKIPWASGLEMNFNDVIRQTGPHNRGFFYVPGFQNGVRFMLDGQVMQ
jgi:type II secretory pathway pseudopilin PulG